MLQFKPIFLGQAPRRHARATTSQKCIRTNDIENVGVTARHHTFFEMLGNFSFGDYFKADAIAMAWELATVRLGIPADRIWVSVYQDDDEAARLWTEVAGVPPERVQRCGAEDNFWASGPTGPCGPCSELYYDLHPERGPAGADIAGDDSRFIEFYNLVFMESNRSAGGELTPLAAQNIDTGMGLERVAQILQGVPNNYETDLIFPLVSAAADLAGIEYAGADDATKTSLKVIGDHARACAFLVSDGVTPSNVGRGYILRRLLRRVVMKGRLLGIQDVFTPGLAAIAADLGAGYDPALAANLARVQDELRREEERFTVTLEAGAKLLDEALKAAKNTGSPIPGAAAFELYDTYGFPLEVTVEAAGEAGVPVDEAGFASAMAAQKARSKAAAKTVDLTAAAALGDLVAEVGATRFVGYEAVAAPACTVVALLSAGGGRLERATTGETVDVLLESTPFYGEGGGQVGDAGELTWEGGLAGVTDTRRAAGGALFVHRATVEAGDLGVGDQVRNGEGETGEGAAARERGGREGGPAFSLARHPPRGRPQSLRPQASRVISASQPPTQHSGRARARGRRSPPLPRHRPLARMCASDPSQNLSPPPLCLSLLQVRATVDPSRRAGSAAHHTATHLLQAALKQVLGEGVAQQGSLVQADRLRFDFNLPRGLEPGEVAAIEGLVNAWVAADHGLTTAVMPLADAKAAGATAMFGEKYDDAGVRVVDVPGVSMELCGGTHVRSTAQIGGFKVLSESGIASGVRRIEAVVGQALVSYLQNVDGVVRTLSARLKVKTEDLPDRVAGVLDELKAAQKEAAGLRSELALAKAGELASAAVTTPSGAKYLVARLDGVDGKALQDAAAALLDRLGDPAAVFLIGASEAGAVMAAAASPGAVKAGLQAGKFIGGLAKMCGGGGGGKPGLAQAGGRDASKVPDALAAAEAGLAEALGK